ncbi:unnamed protein product [Paramecium sonneborni]|uniref:Uncharacterized protein n=1 Tax=Paramecium sonneborni TaxID=65129 RepID=A0A8S1RTU1_9CILI|nr:unnamed protein product [Paramecium sonneborni]
MWYMTFWTERNTLEKGNEDAGQYALHVNNNYKRLLLWYILRSQFQIDAHQKL